MTTQSIAPGGGPLPMPSRVAIAPDLAGVRLEGAHYALRLHPSSDWQAEGDPSVHISVIALPSERREHGINLTYDAPRAFALADIELATTAAGDELRCLRAIAADAGATAFRTGFVMTLEPGMAAHLPATLQRLDRISRAAAQVREALCRQMGRRLWPHEADVLLKMVARLAGQGVVDETGHRLLDTNVDGPIAPDLDPPGDAELGAALRHAEVLQVLEQVREAFAKVSPT